MERNAHPVRGVVVGSMSQYLILKRHTVNERATCQIRKMFCLPFDKEVTEKYGEFTQ